MYTYWCNLLIKVLGFFVCALFVGVLGGIIAASFSTNAQDQISDNDHVLNISMNADFRVHFEQKNHTVIEEDIKNVMTRKPISKVDVQVIEPTADSETDENDTAQAPSSSLAVSITLNYEALNRLQKTDFEAYIWKRLSLLNDTDYLITNISKAGL